MNKLLISGVMASSILVAGSAIAADATGNASVSVNEAIGISQTTAVDFGIVSALNAGTCTMDPSDGSLTGTSCAQATGTPGAFTLTSTAGNLDVTITIATPVNNDITFAPIWNNGSDVAAGATGTFNNGTGTGTLNVGGTLTNGASVTTIPSSWTYNVNVVYQ